MEKENEIIHSTGESKPAAYDPRPQWMVDFHNETKGGSDRFRQWAKSNLNINIDRQLEQDAGNGDTDKARMVLEAIVRKKYFMLYQDAKRFCVVLPKINAIVTIFPGDQHTVEILRPVDFQNRVKMLYVIYPNFEYPSKKIIGAAMKLIGNSGNFQLLLR